MCQCKDVVDKEVDGEPVECDDGEFAMCAIACPYGFHRDDNGCKICKCHEHGNEHVEHYEEDVECSPVTCMSHCEHDYKKDANGCNLCECKEPECSEMQCLMACPHGFRKDPEGCDVCDCRTEEECNGYQCRMTCPYGFLKDKSGCNMCICHDNCEVRTNSSRSYSIRRSCDQCSACMTKIAVLISPPFVLGDQMQRGYELLGGEH